MPSWLQWLWCNLKCFSAAECWWTFIYLFLFALCSLHMQEGTTKTPKHALTSRWKTWTTTPQSSPATTKFSCVRPSRQERYGWGVGVEQQCFTWRCSSNPSNSFSLFYVHDSGDWNHQCSGQRWDDSQATLHIQPYSRSRTQPQLLPERQQR